MRKIFAYGAAGAAGLFGLLVLLGSWYTINQTERGVILRYGARHGVAEPGLNVKLPLIDRVVPISVQTHIMKYEKMVSYSFDQQPAELLVSVNYRIAPDRVAEVYERFGSAEVAVTRLLNPQVNEEAKVVFGRFNAVAAIQERGRLNREVAEAISRAVQGPLIIEAVQIENIDFSSEYEKSIEQRMLAEVEVQRLRQNAEREKVQAEIVVTQARAQADGVRAKAQAEAEAIRLRGEAEAQAIKQRGDALAANPGLVSLVQAERWDGRLPTQMVPNGAVPILSLEGAR